MVAIRNDPRRLVELRGVGNGTGVSGRGANLADWCQMAKVLVSQRCEIRLTDILPPEMALPKILRTEISSGSKAVRPRLTRVYIAIIMIYPQ